LKNENFLISFSVPDVSNRAGQAKGPTVRTGHMVYSCRSPQYFVTIL
jgi:hypothetical protein